MATVERFDRSALKKTNPLLTKLRTTVETAFYGNNMREVLDLAEAYELAKNSGSTIVTDLPVQHTEELGLPSDAKVLVENGGKVYNRTASARRIVGENPEEDEKLEGIVRQVIYINRNRPYYKTTAYVGLDSDFMVKAHIAFPEGQENNMYSWLLNFQNVTPEYDRMYAASKPYPDGDIYIYTDPDWRHPDYPNGVAYFEPDRNVAAILGMQYFGEFKKGTLTLAWGTGHRNKFVACHGGLKVFYRPDGSAHVASFFGLSGSGKSTLTHAKHENRYDIKVLHDDAFLINLEDGSSIALEPAYFDKTQDYPADHPEQDYFVTVQNVGVSLDQDGKKVLVTEDIRNGNGRTVKSRYSTPNRVDKLTEPINAVYWIMKDDVLPPLVKIADPFLGATLGATLATKRSSAENVKKSETNKLVIECYANPFRVYPLKEDFQDFYELLQHEGVECYMINTGHFGDKKIPKEVSLHLIEGIVENTVSFVPFGDMEGLSYMPVEGFEPDFKDHAYRRLFKERMQMRLDYVEDFNKENPGQPLPEEAAASMHRLIDSLQVLN